MKTENFVLTKMARESLRGKWGQVVLVSLVYSLILLAIQLIGEVDYTPDAKVLFSTISFLIKIFVSGPFALGMAIFMLAISRNQEFNLGTIFKGFNTYWKAVGTYLLMVLYTFLWSLLLIIPGIIAALSYSMTFFILVDEQNIGIRESIQKSKKMMQGNKWKLFCLGIRFIGWFLLCVLTFGIGFLWLEPYMGVSFAKFYEDIKGNQGV